jgi:hypothetical protein
MPLRSEVEFGSLLAYTPRDQTPDGRRAWKFVVDLKRDAARSGDGTTAMFVAQRLREELDKEAIALASMFDGSWIAVPVPRSSPTRDGALWPAERIATALRGAGLVRSTQRILRRAQAVAKSATAESKDRPSAAAHYSSMRITLDANSERPSESPLGELVRTELGPRPKLLLVDDVITRGATMLAASSVLLDAIPDASVIAFAVVRTNSDFSEASLLSPRRGWVRLRGEATFRRP